MSNHLFHTFADGSPDHRRQMVNYAGKDRGMNRLDLQHLMGQLGFPSSIIEVDGSMSKSTAYEMAKGYARRYGLPVVTDKENLAHMKSVNVKADRHRKLIRAAIEDIDIPHSLKSGLLKSANDIVEHWRGVEQEKLW